ncbi:hypothetical protein [Pseudoduganella sp. UC29_71]|uniref:hypothetical protein n=1 Tax=Pseudoduganella sp. UC29_71 TaxID=3350174 RepID=UPI003672D84B
MPPMPRQAYFSAQRSCKGLLRYSCSTRIMPSTAAPARSITSGSMPPSAASRPGAQLASASPPSSSA